MADFAYPPENTFVLTSTAGGTAAKVSDDEMLPRPDIGGSQFFVRNEQESLCGATGHYLDSLLAWNAREAANSEFVLKSFGPKPKCLVAYPPDAAQYNPMVMGVSRDNTKLGGGKEACGRWKFTKHDLGYAYALQPSQPVSYIVKAEYQAQCLTCAVQDLFLEHDDSTFNQQWELKPPAW
ncbi:hypothetical protein BJX65DRAFT_312431 [Aspergillus insuetus]